MKKYNFLKRLLAILFVLSGLAVFVSAILYPILNPNLPIATRLIISSAIIADAFCYFIAAWSVTRSIKWLYLFTIVLLIVNAIGIIFDEVGMYDILASAFNILLLGLFVISLNIKKEKDEKQSL